MPAAPAVEARHRLRAWDLGGRARTVTILRVTLQGVEEAQPLAYFQGISLPLALTPTQCNDLARITGSALLHDWAGATVVLDPVLDPAADDGRLTCVIRAPGEPLATRRTQAPELRLSRPVRTVLVIILVGLVFGLVIRAPQTQAMVDWFMSLRPPN